MGDLIDSNRNMLYVGLSGFPKGLAMVSKIKLISRALQLQGIKVLVINRKHGSFQKKEGTSEGIQYTTIQRRPKSKYFLARRINNLLLPFVEWVFISKKVQEVKPGCIIVNSRSFSQLLLYLLVAKKYKLKIILTYVEYGKSMSSKNSLSKINDILFEVFAFKWVDAVLPISEFLISIVKKHNSSVPILKTPVLTDIEYIDRINAKVISGRFLFCGGAAYLDVIQMVIESFELVKSKNATLILICGGTESEKNRVRDLIYNSEKSNSIAYQYGLTFDELIESYKSSMALLIPLRPTLQDKARFPHKIGEYAATGRPIISNNFGEVGKYFSDNDSAFLAEKYTAMHIAKKMDYVIENHEKATVVGAKGRDVAKAHFDYKAYGVKLKRFLQEL